METQNLIQYIFWDGSETITNLKGKLIAIKYPDTDYLPLEFRLDRYVQGSTPDKNSTAFSNVPNENEHLLTATKFLGFGQRISSSRIREINHGFQLEI